MYQVDSNGISYDKHESKTYVRQGEHLLGGMLRVVWWTCCFQWLRKTRDMVKHVNGPGTTAWFFVVDSGALDIHQN